MYFKTRNIFPPQETARKIEGPTIGLRYYSRTSSCRLAIIRLWKTPELFFQKPQVGFDLGVALLRVARELQRFSV